LLEERRGLWPDVDNDVEDLSIGTPNEFGLAVASSHMKSAYHTVRGPRDTVLDECIRINTVLSCYLGIERPAEEAAVIAMWRWLEKQQSGDGTVQNFHHEALVSGGACAGAFDMAAEVGSLAAP
jgi:hypothetical protein